MSEQPIGLSGSREPAPLVRLRAQDVRPLHQQWRDRIGAVAGSVQLSTWIAIAAVSGALLFVLSSLRDEPEQVPIEHVLPFAGGTTTESGTNPIDEGTETVASSSLVVHVAGAVARPGLITGVEGWRVADAIEAASGTAADADLDRVNLAALVSDGERIYIPRVGEPAAPVVVGESGDDDRIVGPVDLNSADARELETLPGIGPATAATIIDHRDEHGPFGSVDALIAVRGIGAAKLDGIREHVTAG